MPRPKGSFDTLYPCDFYTPSELLDDDQMYTVYEIARLLQGLEPDAELNEGTEEILLDWAIPWVMRNSDSLVVAEPPSEDEPGYYGLRDAADVDREDDEAGEGVADGEDDGDGRGDGADDGDRDASADAADDEPEAEG